MTNHGGKRKGAGRKKAEPMMRVRIPVRLKDEFYAWRELQMLPKTYFKSIGEFGTCPIYRKFVSKRIDS